MSDRTTPITRRQEIALVTGRELRAHLLKKSTIILTLVLLIAAVGGIVGGRLTFDTSGLDFVMTALFVVIFVDQWMNSKRRSHMAALTGIVVPVICLALFGADDFMIPSLLAMLVMFLMVRPYLGDLKTDGGFDERENRAR